MPCAVPQGKPLPKVVTPAKVDLPANASKFGAAPADTRRAGVESTAKYAAKTEGSSYGDLAERKARLDSKYNPELEKELRGWIEAKTGLTLDGKGWDGAEQRLSLMAWVACAHGMGVQPTSKLR